MVCDDCNQKIKTIKEGNCTIKECGCNLECTCKNEEKK